MESLNQGRCGFVNQFNIITRDSKGEVCYIEEEVVDIIIIDMDGNKVPNNVIDNEDGSYKVTYKPDNRVFRIWALVGRSSIRNSPQTVRALRLKAEIKPVRIHFGKGSGEGQLNIPFSIVLADDGQIAIADRGNHRIQIFSEDGRYLREFGVQGTRDGELTNPFGVVFNDDAIIVSDNPDDKGRLQEFDMNGEYRKTLYRRGERLRGICVADDNNIAVCCIGNAESGSGIKVFNRQGEMIREFNENEEPWNIAYSNGKYYASYFDKNYIRSFDEEGRVLSTFGEKGKSGCQFDSVSGLAVYGPDLILVCDLSNHRVQLLTQEKENS